MTARTARTPRDRAVRSRLAHLAHAGDALYAEKTFPRMVRRAHKRFVVVLKDDRREVYDEARRLRGAVQPRTWAEKDRRCTVCDIERLWSWRRGPKIELRVVWSEEKSRREAEWVESTWGWLTSLPVTAGSVADTR